MSGPKDYSYAFEISRRIRLEAQSRATKQKRAKQVQEKLAATSRQSRRQIDELLAAQAAANKEAFDRDRQIAARAHASPQVPIPPKVPQQLASEKLDQVSARTADELASARKDMAALAEVLGRPENCKVIRDFEQALSAFSSETPDSFDAVTKLRAQIGKATREAKEDVARLRQLFESLAAWRPLLAEDQDVQDFQAIESQQWKQEVEQLLAQGINGSQLETTIVRTQTAIQRAESISEKAGDIRARFTERNELLKDIIESLKQIGFFVTDPKYEDGKNPAGPVILCATRGDEQMTAHVDLSENVRSEWLGVEDTKCKEAFFAYVDAMSHRGVEVSPTRPDLQDRPLLKRKGEKELPRQQDRSRGGDNG